MLRELHIELIEQIRKPTAENRVASAFASVLLVLLYPLIIVVGLVYMLIIFAWSFLKFGNSSEAELSEAAPLEEKWTLLTTLGDFRIEQKYLHEIRFGPAYFALRSQPEIAALNGRTFGDWFYRHKNGVLLQEWNSTDTPDTNLILIDPQTLEVSIIAENIPAVLWTIVKTDDDRAQLTCDTGQELLTYIIE